MSGKNNGFINENKTAIKNATNILSSAVTKVSKLVSTLCFAKRKTQLFGFWLGLYGHNWIATFRLCQEWVEELLYLIRNKLPFYQRGLIALNLVQQFL
jgi:hypothetical protein